MEQDGKSSRHAKIIGTLGELIICNWLSISGFEVMLVDHTGIDILACRPETGQRYGITVKSRTRFKGSEKESVDIFKKKGDQGRLKRACELFACKPWIAVYVEATDTGSADVYLTSLENYKKYAGESDKLTYAWLMSDKQRRAYEKDSRVKHIKIDFERTNWGAPWE